MRPSVPEFSRRVFIGSSVAAAVAAAQDAASSAVDLRAVIAKSDLIYNKPAPRSEEGIPVGNGRMGTLVWTTPTQLRMQINRPDVYPNNSATNSFFERHNDYCGGCGFVDIDCAAFGSEPFPESGFPQRLSVYDGMLAINGQGVAARMVAWPAQDVMAIEVTDRRTAPEPVHVELRMLRHETKYHGQQLETFVRDHIVMVQTRNHTAASRLEVRGGRIVLTQDFREGEYCCKSAVAIGIVGRESQARIANETAVRLAARPGAGVFTILIASAATFDPKEDVAASALRQLEAASAAGLAKVAEETAAWWRDFWQRGYVALHSADGVADTIQQNYHYYLYVMAASSRGRFPAKFNGMLWNTAGDLRTWGAQHWYANTSCHYEALFTANRMELLDPLFAMYSGMYENCATAARQQWGSKGIYIPETSYFDGLAKLPDDIAAEMRDLYLLRKPWEQRSQRFQEYAQTRHPHSSRWNWIQNGSWKDGRYVITDRGAGPYGAVNHIFGSTAKIAYYYWRRYEFTQDREWLAARAYPMLEGTVEFYRNYPNLRKGADGKHHIHNVNSNESVMGAQDTDEDLSAMRGVTAALLRAAQILNRDADRQPVWREFLENLAPLPTSDDAAALKPDNYQGPRVFVRGLKPSIRGAGLLPDGNSLPMWLFDLCHVGTSDRRALETANNTFSYNYRNGIGPNNNVSVLSKWAIAGTSLGRVEATRYLIPAQIEARAPERGTAYKNGGVLANRMTLREGPQALDVQRLGRASEALHMALVQSNPPMPGEDPVITLFPAWPQEWDAQYRLAARGGFLVNARYRGGRVESVELESQAGGECKLRNPWGTGAVTLHRGARSERVSGALLRFTTSKGERIRVTPS